MASRTENSIEQAWVRWCKREKIRQRKLADLGNAGYPDRTISCGGGKTCCIEFKKPGGVLRPLQRRRIAELKDEGIEVLVTSDLEEAKEWTLKRCGYRIGTKSQPRRSSTTTRSRQ